MDKKRGFQVNIQKITLTSEFSFKISRSNKNERNMVYHPIFTHYLWRTSGPADVCLFLDILCDTINDLLACKSWDEK